MEVTFLIVLEILNMYEMTLDNVQKMEICDKQQFKTPLVRENDHIYYQWNGQDEIRFTTQEICKLE